MDEANLKVALEHDQAIKNEAPQQVEITLDVLARQLETKQVYIARVVSLSAIDIARHCLGSVLPNNKVVDGATIEEVPLKVDQANKFMTLAEKALDLAHRADCLADKSVVRETPKKA